MESNKKKIPKVPHQNYTESRNTPYCITRRYGSVTFDESLSNLKNSLQKADFDIIAEMDIEKYLGDYVKGLARHKVLMVCNKKTAAELVSHDLQITTLLPCKISVKELKEESLVEVVIEDIQTTWSTSEKSEIKKLAKDVKQSLTDILDSIEQLNIKL